MFVIFLQDNPNGSGTTADHFAPRFLVGNLLRGAPTLAQSGYARYEPDPGDGTGIAQALAEMLALGVACDLCIGEGVYTRAPGLARFVVPAGCRVWSTGGTTIVTNDVDDCVFQLGAGATLERISLTQRGTLAAAGSALVECPAGSTVIATLRDLILTTPVQVRGAQLVGGSYELDNVRVSFTGGGAAPVGINVEGAANNPASFDAHDCFFSLVNIGIRFGFAATVQDSRIAGCRMTLANAIVPVAAGSFSTNSLAIGNVSRGSGSTLPTDAGVGNSIAPGVANIWGA